MFDTGLGQGWWPLADLVTAAEFRQRCADQGQGRTAEIAATVGFIGQKRAVPSVYPRYAAVGVGRPSTLRSYTEHVERYLIPHLGRIGMGELTGRQVADMTTTVAATPTRHGHSLTPSTMHRVRATLRLALTAAIRDGLRPDNPARHIELPTPTPRRP